MPPGPDLFRACGRVSSSARPVPVEQRRRYWRNVAASDSVLASPAAPLPPRRYSLMVPTVMALLQGDADL